MRFRTGLAAVIFIMAVPGVAQAQGSGTITNVQPIGGGQMTATYTSVFSHCTSAGYCGWFPYALQVPAGQPCVPGDTNLVYVGDVTTSTTEGPQTESFFPEYSVLTICLYASQPEMADTLLAQYTYTPSTVAPAPSPTPVPPPVATATPPPTHEHLVPLTIAEAKGLVAPTLTHKYRRRFAKSTLSKSCGRLSRLEVRCHVSWHKKPYKYSGTVTLWYDQSDADGDYSTYTYSTSIRRKRVHARTKKHPAAGPACDRNYAGACLNPDASDYDCAGGSGNGPLYVTGPIRVVGDDHYGLDADGDGTACD